MTAEPFVGRERELERLREAFDGARAGRGGVALISGAPGIGKTRLARELERYAVEHGGRVLWGRTHEADGAPAYWPWVQALRQLAEAADGEALRGWLGGGASEVARIIPELREHLPDLPEPEPIGDPQSARFRLFDAVTTFIGNAASTTPLVVVLDDLHWADRSTLLLLEHAALELHRANLLIIGTYRDVELGREHPLEQALAGIGRAERFQTIDLRGLSEDDVAAYVRETTGVEPPAEAMRSIYRETDGNAFFLREVVALMSREETLESGEVSVPPSVRAAIGRRLSALTEQCNELLRTAAVVGREFSEELLARLSDHGVDQVPELLETALNAGVIDETEPAGEYRFTHALIQETLLDEVRASQRVRLHGRIAAALEDLYSHRAADHAAELAHHFVESAPLTNGHAEQALRYSKLAAEQAEAQTGWSEAARRYEDCLTLIVETDTALEADEPELLVAAGRCHLNANAPRDAWRRLLQAIDLYRAREDAVGIAGATLEALAVQALPAHRLALGNEALDLLGDAEPGLEAKILGRMLARWGVELDQSLRDRYRERASRLAVRHDLSDVKALLQVVAASEAFAAGRHSEAAAGHLEAQRQFEALGLMQDASAAYRRAAVNLTLVGRIGQARDVAEDGLAYTRRCHLPGFEQLQAAHLAGLLLGLCEFEALAAVLKEQAGATAWLLQAVAVSWALQRGDLAAAEDALPAMQLASGVSTQEAQLHALHARFRLLSGQRDAASEHFAKMLEAMQLAVDTGRTVAGTRIESQALERAGEAGFELADDTFLGVMLEFYQTAGDDVPYLSPLGMSPRELYGRYALALGEVADAERAFAETLTWAERERAHVIVGQCHQGLAEVAVRRGETAEAMRHLDAANELFEQHGAKLYLDQVIATIEGLVTTPHEERSGEISQAPDGLTAREVEVVAEVARGLTNAAIGEVLFISPGTVARHVSNILKKTRLSNRTELARYAAERGLTT